MNVKCPDEYGIRLIVTGTPLELDVLEDTIDRYVRQLDTDMPAMPVCTRWKAKRMDVLMGIGLELGLYSMRTSPPALQVLEDVSAYRVYQLEAVEALLGAPAQRGLVCAPTGAGKTRIAARLVQRSIPHCKSGGWLYLVTNKELAAQAEQEILSLVPSARELLVCSTYKSEIPQRIWDGIIVDEVHESPAIERMRVLAGLRARARYGMSGTPLDRSNGGNARVIGLFGPIVYSITMVQLESEGYLPPGTVINVNLRY